MGILEICWVEDIGIIIFFRFFEKKGRVILWEKKIFIVYIYIFFCFYEIVFLILKFVNEKKKYIDESWELYFVWVMNFRNKIYLDFDIFENKVKVNCKIIFF